MRIAHGEAEGEVRDGRFTFAAVLFLLGLFMLIVPNFFPENSPGYRERHVPMLLGAGAGLAGGLWLFFLFRQQSRLAQEEQRRKLLDQCAFVLPPALQDHATLLELSARIGRCFGIRRRVLYKPLDQMTVQDLCRWIAAGKPSPPHSYPIDRESAALATTIVASLAQRPPARVHLCDELNALFPFGRRWQAWKRLAHSLGVVLPTPDIPSWLSGLVTFTAAMLTFAIIIPLAQMLDRKFPAEELHWLVKLLAMFLVPGGFFLVLSVISWLLYRFVAMHFSVFPENLRYVADVAQLLQSEADGEAPWTQQDVLTELRPIIARVCGLDASKVQPQDLPMNFLLRGRGICSQ